MSDPVARLTLPTMMTLARLASIPVFVAVFYAPFRWAPLAAAIIFVVAGLTDMLDGYLARRLKQTTRFGAFLDPVADKLIVRGQARITVDEDEARLGPGDAVVIQLLLEFLEPVVRFVEPRLVFLDLGLALAEQTP